MPSCGLTETIFDDCVLSPAPRPPITYAVEPITAAAAWVVGAGRLPIRMTRPVDGTNSRTAVLAFPLGSEPPAISSRLPTAVTAA